MHSRHTLWLGLLIVAVSVAACGPKASPQPTVATTPRPSATATRSAAAPGTGEVPVGFTEDGLPYRGNPNALVTLVEHSEFQ